MLYIIYLSLFKISSFNLIMDSFLLADASQSVLISYSSSLNNLFVADSSLNYQSNANSGRFKRITQTTDSGSQAPVKPNVTVKTKEPANPQSSAKTKPSAKTPARKSSKAAIVPSKEIDPSVERGKHLASSCSVCHGANGISTADFYPNLKGQKYTYLYNSLYSYKRKQRIKGQAILMYPHVEMLTDQDIKDLANYYSKL